MKFWSLSRLVCNNPVMPGALVRDLVEWAQTGRAPAHMFAALGQVVKCTAPQYAEGLAMVQGVASPDRRVFLSYPDAEALEQLERFCVFEMGDGNIYCHVDAMH